MGLDSRSLGNFLARVDSTMKALWGTVAVEYRGVACEGLLMHGGTQAPVMIGGMIAQPEAGLRLPKSAIVTEPAVGDRITAGEMEWRIIRVVPHSWDTEWHCELANPNR